MVIIFSSLVTTPYISFIPCAVQLLYPYWHTGTTLTKITTRLHSWFGLPVKNMNAIIRLMGWGKDFKDIMVLNKQLTCYMDMEFIFRKNNSNGES